MSNRPREQHAASATGFDAFLSYARNDDTEFREALVAGLSGAGVSIFFDHESLPSRGTTFDQELRRAIESSDRLLLLCGPDALASAYVAEEWGFADDIGVPVIPVLRGSTYADLPERLSSYHAVDGAAPRPVADVVAELARLLTEPVQSLGACHRVPGAAVGEVARPDLLEQLWAALGVDRQRPLEAGRAPRAAALYGESGVGKSTIAAAFARSIRTRRTFPDGIAWVTTGPSFAPLAAARDLLSQVAVGARLPGSAVDVPAALAEGIGDKEVLVVLDDVRDADAAAPFVAALGAGGRALVTALDQAVATALGAVEAPVDRLDDAAARALLTSFAGDTLPDEADAVLEACDGLPFALAIVGAMVRNRVPWDRVVEALESRRLDLLAVRFPGYPHPNLLRALGASFDALSTDEPQAAACYLELAAFRPGAELTEAAMVRFWSRPGRLSELEASLVVAVLERRLLLHRRAGAHGERFVLHRLHEDFVRLECSDAAGLEAALVAAYRAQKGDREWSSLPDDGYVYDNLVAHLAARGEYAELVGAVDEGWVARQLERAGDLAQARDDVQEALGAAVGPPLDLPAVTRLAVLLGRLAAALREVPNALPGALAWSGRLDPAVRWAADKPDPDQRFDAVLAVAEALVGRGELTLARRLIRTAAGTIPAMGAVVETGLIPDLTALNAVHALVDFPAPDEWEGTNDQLVALARIPVDAVLRLAPLAAEVGAMEALAAVRHPFWVLYAHLIPLVAVEELAERGHVEVARALLDRIGADDDYVAEDLAHAAAYRRAVALAAVGDFDGAIAGIAGLPDGYIGVGRRGIARHLAAAGRDEEAAELIPGIDDPSVANAALSDVIDATLDRADPEACRRVAELALDHDWVVAAAWLMAAAGEPEMGIDLLSRASTDDLALGVGVRVGSIALRAGMEEQAAEVAQQLVPFAERLLGPQWFAPETLNVAPEVAALGNSLRLLVIRAGQPLPDIMVPLAVLVESQGAIAGFKVSACTELAMSGRTAEALRLADESVTPTARSLALALAIAAADPSTDGEQLSRAAAGLAEAVRAADPARMLDDALGAAVRALVSHGLDDAARQVVEELVGRPGLWAAVGAWALTRARAGDVDAVDALVQRMVVHRPLRAPSARMRAMLLAAVARRRPGPSGELAAAADLLADVRVAAGALDVVFDVVALHASHFGLEPAAELTGRIPAGTAAELAEEWARGGEIGWEGDVSQEEIAGAAVARAVAAASLALAAAGSGELESAHTWLERAHDLAGRAASLAPHSGVEEATAKYVRAAAAVADPDAWDDEDPATLMRAVWLLWLRGWGRPAVETARRDLPELAAPLSALEGRPRIVTVEDLERRSGVVAGARAGLGAILAIDAAARGQDAEAKGAAEAAMGETASYGWTSLTYQERSEIHAWLAIAAQRAGQPDAALDQLRQAAAPAIALARRGEIGAFERLSQAAVEVLVPEQAALAWSDWLVAAAEGGGDLAVGLIAAYVQWLPEQVLASIAVRAETGELLRAG